MATILSMSADYEARRAELAQMLEVQRGRLANLEAEVVEARAVLHRLEGGIIEQERWIEMMRAQEKKPEGEPAPAEETL